MSTIFVTSLPRCGSTWTAQALSVLTSSRYVHEPFNWTTHPERRPYGIRYMRSGDCDPGFTRILDDSVRPEGMRGRISELLRGRNVVLKDVHCWLSVECVQKHLDARTVILTRHPCAVANSWKKMGWKLDTPRSDMLLQQEELVKEHLAPFVTHIRSSRDPFFQIGAYWGASYYVLRRIARAHPEWQWIAHEDLCQEPEQAFGALLERLGVRMREDAVTFFDKHNRPLKDGETPYRTFRITREEPGKWKESLAPEEIGAVLRGAEPFGMEELLHSPQLRSTTKLRAALG